MIFLTKPLSACFNRISNKEAAFSPRRIKMAFAAGVLTYGVSGACGVKMAYEMADSGHELHLADMMSWNAIGRGGPWGAAMVGVSYIGDAFLLYGAFGALYQRRRRKELATTDNEAFPQPNTAKPLFGRDSPDARL